MSPGDGLRHLAHEARRLAQAMPVSVVELLAQTLGAMEVSGEPPDRAKVVEGIAHPHYRSLAVAFLDGWRAKAAGVPIQAVAAALLTAAAAEQAHRGTQTVEPV